MNIKMDPFLERMYHQFNVSVPEPFSEPTANTEFIPIVLIHNFEHQDSFKSKRSKKIVPKQEPSKKILREEDVEIYSSKKSQLGTANNEIKENKWKQYGGNCKVQQIEVKKEINQAFEHSIEEQKGKCQEQDQSISVVSDLNIQSKKIQQGKKLQFEQKKQTYIKWNQEENMMYLAFLRENQHLFKDIYTRRTKKPYKMMSEFIKTRDHEQCRSHHQKMIKKHKSLQYISLQLERRNKKEITKREKNSKMQESEETVKFKKKEVDNLKAEIEDKIQKVDVESSILMIPSLIESNLGSSQTNAKSRKELQEK